MAKPFLKWVGGKRAMLPHLIACLPSAWNSKTHCYYEPFLGGGALYFELQPKRAQLSDINNILIDTWSAVSDYLRVTELIPKLKTRVSLHSEEKYYQVRDRFNITPRVVDFIYLNYAGFNGLYRLNNTGGYNVPLGRSAKNKRTGENDLYINYDNFLDCNSVLHRLKPSIRCEAFTKIKPPPGSFVYFDPPYDSMFTDYNAGGFTRDHQFDLALFFKKLSYQGVYCMLSNADTPFIRERYKNFNIIEVTTRQNVSGLAHGRGPRKELIITNY